MRIAIDYTAAIRQRAGIGNYVRRLVDAMLEQDAINQYTLLTSGRPTRERPFPTAENVHGRSIFIPDRSLPTISQGRSIFIMDQTSRCPPPARNCARS